MANIEKNVNMYSPSHYHTFREQGSKLKQCPPLWIFSFLSLSFRQTSAQLWEHDLLFLRAFALENLSL